MSRAADAASTRLRRAARDYSAKVASAEQLMLACKFDELALAIGSGRQTLHSLAGDVKRAATAINEAHDAGDALEAAALRFARAKGGRR